MSKQIVELGELFLCDTPRFWTATPEARQIRSDVLEWLNENFSGTGRMPWVMSHRDIAFWSFKDALLYIMRWEPYL